MKPAKTGPRRKPGVPHIPGIITCNLFLWNTPTNFQKIADILDENGMPGPASDLRNQLIAALVEMVKP